MFVKLFQKSNKTQLSPSASSSQPNVTADRMALSKLTPQVLMHYGIPSTASVLAFDPVQSLLAIGTLDGRIKIIGGDNIEAILISPQSMPFKNLEFLRNQGFLVSVSNENEIQVWDLEKRCISSDMRWESNITAFSVISGTHYMYLGDEYGFLSVLKYDVEEGKIYQLPYHVPPNFITEVAGISLPEHLSIVGVLAQPCSCGNRVLIAYENGLIVLWDIAEDRAVHVRGYKDLQLKQEIVVNFSNSENSTSLNDSLDNEEAEKEISSACWVSPDGSVLAVGYVDGDILLWDLSVSDNSKGQKKQKSPNDVVKIQLSSGDKRLPVIVLHWLSNKAQNSSGGQLFVYGGEDIGSEEVLTILDLDWSSGLAKLKCIERVDLTLHGSFADVMIVSSTHNTGNNSATSLFVLSNPGQLHFYEYASLSTFKSERRKNPSLHERQYHAVIPTVEPYMTVGKLYCVDSDRSPLTVRVSSATLSDDVLTGRSIMWPLTGGVPCQISASELNAVEKIYIGGYQDGSIRIWDATSPVLSLVSHLGFEIKGILIDGGNASVSALDFFSPKLNLAIGNESGVIFLYNLQGDSDQTTLTIVTETKQDVHHLPCEERNRCFVIYTVLNSPVRALQFTASGIGLVAGFECGQVAVLDTVSLSVVFVTDYLSSSRSSIISLAVKSSPPSHESDVDNSVPGTRSEYAVEIAFILTRDAHVFLMDITGGNMISSQPMQPKENSKAMSMFLLEGKPSLSGGSKNDSTASSDHMEDQTHQSLESHQASDILSTVKETLEYTDLQQKILAFQMLLCCEDALYIYALKSVIQGNSSFARELKLEKPCSWSTILKIKAEEYGFILVYQTGEIEIRSLPDLELLGSTSVMSILRWSFKNNMDKTMSASDRGQITLVNGREFAFVSLLASENEFRAIESLPCLHDKVVAAASEADFDLSQNHKKPQITLPGFVSDVIKGLKGIKQEKDMNYKEAHDIVAAHLERIFSRFPFSDSYDAYDQEQVELNIDDIDIDEPVLPASTSKNSDDIKAHQEKEAVREKLFEGGSADTEPRVRTREEIILKYKYKGDAAAAASEAKDKLLERQEKLELRASPIEESERVFGLFKLSRRTEELQNGAENFASMANELAKAMEKRKWWNI